MASCGPSEKDLQLKLRKAVQQGETNVICRLVKGGVSVNDTTWVSDKYVGLITEITPKFRLIIA